MKLSTPLPQALPKECAKAAKILQSFVGSGSSNGLDGVVPRSVLDNAKGFAIFTVFKAGFLFSARAGSGIVIAKLYDGTWSAPSAIGTAGVGFGGQAGAEMTDFLVVLNSRSAIKSFMAAGSLTLGGNMSIAVGPIGRNGEASGSVNTSGSVAAMYSYSKTRGLFGGISIEGSMIVERQDANARAYRSDVTVKQLLSGSIEPPEWASPLIRTLELCTGMPGNRQWVQEGMVQSGYAFNGVGSPGREGSLSSKGKTKKGKSNFPPAHWGNSTNSATDFGSDFQEEDQPRAGLVATSRGDDRLSGFETHFDSDFAAEVESHQRPRPGEPTTRDPDDNLYDDPVPPYNHFSISPLGTSNHTNHTRSASMVAPFSSSMTHKKSFSFAPSSNPFYPSEEEDIEPMGRNTNGTGHYIQPKPELAKLLSPSEGVARAIALFDFKAVEPGDLSFAKGDVITITQMSDSNDDWWTGKVSGSQGIFPANHVEVV